MMEQQSFAFMKNLPKFDIYIVVMAINSKNSYIVGSSFSYYLAREISNRHAGSVVKKWRSE